MAPLLLIAATLLGASVIARGLAAKRTGTALSPVVLLDLALIAAALGLVATGATDSGIAVLLAPATLIYVLGRLGHRFAELRRIRRIRELSEGRRLETFVHVARAREDEEPEAPRS